MSESSQVKHRGRPPKHPWEKWTNGKIHILRRGTDFTATCISVRTMMHRKARDQSAELGYELGAHTDINKADQSVKIQFYRRDGKPLDST